MRFPKGRRVLLDLHATNRSSAWQDPDVFRPDRFAGDDGAPFKLIPQGGGDHYGHHRCPGAWTTLALMKVAVRILTERNRYELPDQEHRMRAEWGKSGSVRVDFGVRGRIKKKKN